MRPLTQAGKERERQRIEASKVQWEAKAKADSEARDAKIRDGVSQLMKLPRPEAIGIISKIADEVKIFGSNGLAADMAATYLMGIGEPRMAAKMLERIGDYNIPDAGKWMEDRGYLQSALELYAESLTVSRTDTKNRGSVESYLRVAKALGVEPDNKIVTAYRIGELIR